MYDAHLQDGETVVSGSVDRTARVWDLRGGEYALHVLEGKDADGVTSVAAEGRLAAAADLAGVVRVWDIRTGDLQHELQVRTRGELLPKPARANTNEDGLIMRRQASQ